MKILINKLCIVVLILVMVVGIFVCVDDNKIFYDLEYKIFNLMEEISVLIGFDWLLIYVIKFNVEVNDEFDGQYYYIVEIVDKNLFEVMIEEFYNILVKGVVRKGEIYQIEVVFFKDIKYFYVCQIDLCGRDWIKQVEIDELIFYIQCFFIGIFVIKMRVFVIIRGNNGGIDILKRIE